MPKGKKSSPKIAKRDMNAVNQIVLSGPQVYNVLQDAVKKSATSYLKSQDTKLKTKSARDDNPTNLDEAGGSDSGMMLDPMDKRDDATAGETYAIEPPDAYTRLFATKYLPLAWRITHGVANDVFKTGEDFPFSFVYSQQHEVEKTNWSDDVLSIMRDINYLTSAQQCMGNARMDGEGIILLIEEGFDWKETKTEEERDIKKKIVATICIPMYYVNYGVSMKVEDWNFDGTPKYYMINLGATISAGRQSGKTTRWHYTRILHHTPNPIDTDPKGLCVLERCWQAILIGFNIDLACGEFAFRWGMGHPVFETGFTDQKDLERFMKKLGNPTRRTWHALMKDMKLTFAGPNGSPAGMDVIKEKCCYDEVIVGTGEPKPILKGEVAGVQSGSEVNERTHWGVLMIEQTAFNKTNWKMCAILNETKQVTIPEMDINWEYNTLSLPKGLTVKWTVHYVETESEKVKILNEKLDAIGKMSTFSTVNEQRAMARELLNWKEEDYPDLPPEVGDQLPSMFQSAGFGPNDGGNEEEPEPEEKKEPKKKEKANTPEKAESKPEKEETPDKVKKDIGIGPIVGCPDHASYNKTCPMCAIIVHQKTDLALVMIHKGFTPKRISEFLHFDYNKVVEIRNGVQQQSAST